ncbi:hypothetical protein GCM10010523_03570 [Paenarthrobacter ilicis]
MGVLGDSSATSTSALPSTPAPAGATNGATTSGNGGVLSGTQVVLPITVPISTGATSVGIGGESTSTVHPPVVTPPVVTPPVVNPPVVNPPVVTPPVVNPPVVTPPVVNPPVVTPPVVNPPVVAPPTTVTDTATPTTGITTAALVTRSAPTGTASGAQGAAAAAATAAVGSPAALASTGLNPVFVFLAGAMMLMGLLLTTLGRRKAATSRR